MHMSHAEYVPVLKALADETRLKIVDMLAGQEMCACKILEAFSITQPTLSYHMKILTGCGIVDGRRDGAWMHYRLNTERAAMLAEFMAALAQAEAVCGDTVCDCDCGAKGKK